MWPARIVLKREQFLQWSIFRAIPVYLTVYLTLIMTHPRMQSCLSSLHVLLEVNFKFIYFNVITKLANLLLRYKVKLELKLNKLIYHFYGFPFSSYCSAIDERMAYTLHSRVNCSRTLCWSNIRRGPGTSKVRSCLQSWIPVVCRETLQITTTLCLDTRQPWKYFNR